MIAGAGRISVAARLGVRADSQKLPEGSARLFAGANQQNHHQHRSTAPTPSEFEAVREGRACSLPVRKPELGLEDEG
jgi:hypothetical protein